MSQADFAVASAPGSRVNARRLYGGIGSSQGFNRYGIILYAVPGFLSTMLFDRGRFGGDWQLWLAMALAGYLSAVFFYVLGALVYRRLLPRIGERPLAVQLYFGFIGLVRAYVIFGLGTLWQIIPPSDWLFRLLGGPIFTGVTLGIGVILGINFSRSADESQRLNEERMRLRELQASMQQRIATQRAELIGRVRGILAPALASLRSQLSDAGQSRELIATITSTVDEVVRPLSHSIAAADADVDVVKIAGTKRVWSISLWHPVLLRRLILPQLGAILITLSTLPAAVALRPGPSGFTTAAVEGITTFLALHVVRFATYRVRLPIAIGGLITALLFAANQFLVLLVLRELGMPPTDGQGRDLVIFGLVFGAFFAVGQSVQSARGIAVQELGEVTQKLELLISRLRQEVWLNNRRMARVLHGPVQAALYAAGMKLSSASKIDQELIDTVERDIADAVDRIDIDVEMASDDFAEVINQIVSLWRGSCEISVFITEESSAALYQDRNAAACVVEVVQEAISNAVKHGRASNASVMISKVENLAEVRVRNDGTALAQGEKASEGLGSQILDEICHKWSIENRSKGVVLVAQIALAS
ncbi:MAG: hypothetical protein RL645_246 [Actinomycetota bacterium]|jgi:signal transduction histidine kinase